MDNTVTLTKEELMAIDGGIETWFVDEIQLPIKPTAGIIYLPDPPIIVAPTKPTTGIIYIPEQTI